MRQSNIIYIDQMLYASVKVIELIETDTHYQLPLSVISIYNPFMNRPRSLSNDSYRISLNLIYD